jgi:threonine dehydrogenase-like Zn-dependent dehydrogenase
MKALAWFGSKDVRIVDAPIPAVTEPDDVIIRVTASTICGSDLHL